MGLRLSLLEMFEESIRQAPSRSRVLALNLLASWRIVMTLGTKSAQFVHSVVWTQTSPGRHVFVSETLAKYESGVSGMRGKFAIPVDREPDTCSGLQ